MMPECNNMFGCVEMDKIATKIVQTQRGIWDSELSFDNDFDDADHLPLFMMAVFGWIESVETNGDFFMSDKFMERIQSLASVPVERRHLHG